jgi:hypothetical protein
MFHQLCRAISEQAFDRRYWGCTTLSERECSGNCRPAAHFYPCVSDALMIEALAVRDGLILAAEQEVVTRVVLETDNAILAALVPLYDGFRSVTAGVWHEIRELSLPFASFVCTMLTGKAMRQRTCYVHGGLQVFTGHWWRGRLWSGPLVLVQLWSRD